jgi:hypothetical protein
MLSKCLNSACSTPFRYLREGRIFHLQIPASSDSPGSALRREYFWLCGQCCTRLTVVVKNGVGTVQPRFLELPTGERLEQSEEESSFLG